MKIARSAGILLHPSSLPGPYGIGDFGSQAYRWIDFMADSGCSYWQILPLGPTGFGDSPYQSFSSFAGNPVFISPEFLGEEGLLADSELLRKPNFPNERIDFAQVNEWRSELLAKAYRRFLEGHDLRDEFSAYRGDQKVWLDDFSLFTALKKRYAGVAWMDWPVPLRDREPKAIKEVRQTLEKSITYYAFEQFFFFRHWKRLRSYMREKGISIIGDLPIYAAQDSADVWTGRELFQLDSNGRPSAVSGVPPDYFSETGQLWGNPLYRWEKHSEEDYSWWRARIKASLKMVDILRLDHFRGFADYWAVPANEATAVNGRWELGPGETFFQSLIADLGELAIIAEDLGEISPEVFELRDQFSFPGMKILQFAFDDGLEHEFLPHNYPENCVAYTGTHDNDTTQGWFKFAPENERDFCKDYLRTEGSNIAWDFIHAVWGSSATLAIAPLQDFLELDSEARMNYPSSAQGNWAWRMGKAALSKDLSSRISELNAASDRIKPKSK